MTSRKKKVIKSTFFKDRFFLLSLLILLVALFSYQPRHPSLKSSVQPSEDVSIASTSSSLFIKQATADAKNEDYCLTVPVLLYHHIQPLYLSSEKHQDGLTVGVEYFDMHMNYLSSNGYISLSADHLVNALLNREELPPKSIVVTLDDGYEDNYLYAYPILKKYNIIGNFMISTGLMGKDDYMTWEQLQEMTQSSVVRLYNHTSHHVDVGNVSSDIIQKEIKSAQETLVNKTGSNFPIFTYPYGSVSESTKNILRQQGFAGAFTTKAGFTQCRNSILELHRDHVGNLPLSSYGL